MKYYLVKYNGNYADEFDVYFHQVMSEDELKELKESIGKTSPIIGFENEEEFVERNYETGEVEGPAHDLGMFPIEKLTKWDEDGFIKYPLINIKSIKFYPDTYYCRWRDKNRSCLTIEIESDNDEAVREIFTMLAGLANGGHCCGGLIRLNKQQMQDGSWVAKFELDGDGCDRIYYVDDEYLD